LFAKRRAAAAHDHFQFASVHANFCLQKPVNWDAFDRLVTGVDTVWLRRAKLTRPTRIVEAA
jgi:hypothetical protein